MGHPNELEGSRCSLFAKIYFGHLRRGYLNDAIPAITCRWTINIDLTTGDFVVIDIASRLQPFALQPLA